MPETGCTFAWVGGQVVQLLRDDRVCSFTVAVWGNGKRCTGAATSGREGRRRRRLYLLDDEHLHELLSGTVETCADNCKCARARRTAASCEWRARCIRKTLFSQPHRRGNGADSRGASFPHACPATSPSPMYLRAIYKARGSTLHTRAGTLDASFQAPKSPRQAPLEELSKRRNLELAFSQLVPSERWKPSA